MLGVPRWAQPYLGVACLLHMLWFFTALMWQAAVYLRTAHHRQDELSRALAKQEAVHAKARPCCHALFVAQTPFVAVAQLLVEGGGTGLPVHLCGLYAHRRNPFPGCCRHCR